MVKIRPVFAWYDFWIGVYWDRRERRAYIFPFPMVGIVVDFRPLCTGITASWCPRCGLCICSREESMDNPQCPLHSDDSRHAE